MPPVKEVLFFVAVCFKIRRISNHIPCPGQPGTADGLTLLGSATLIKESYRLSSFSQFFPHRTSLAPPVWNNRAHSVEKEEVGRGALSTGSH